MKIGPLPVSCWIPDNFHTKLFNKPVYAQYAYACMGAIFCSIFIHSSGLYE